MVLESDDTVFEHETNGYVTVSLGQVRFISRPVDFWLSFGPDRLHAQVQENKVSSEQNHTLSGHLCPVVSVPSFEHTQNIFLDRMEFTQP